MRRYVIGIDPGLDDVRLAIFDRELYAGDNRPESALKALREQLKFKTSPKEEMFDRASSIALQVEGHLRECGRNAVAHIELPRYAGGFGQRGRNKSSKVMAVSSRKLNVAIGAIVAACALAGCEVQSIAPQDKVGRMSGKEATRFFIEQACAAIKMAPPTNEDARDAMWIGVRALLSGSEPQTLLRNRRV